MKTTTLLLTLIILSCTKNENNNRLDAENVRLKTSLSELVEAVTKLECTILVTGHSDKFLIDTFIIMNPVGTPHNAENMLKHINKLVALCVDDRKASTK